MPETTTLTLAHSPDPDDVFMWWPITGKVDPHDHCRVVEPPVIDTGRFRFQALPADIDVLNRRAVERGDLDITAISIGTYPRVRGVYALTACGSSMGFGYGPKVVARTDGPVSHEQSLDSLRRLVVQGFGGRPFTVAIPGRGTTAFLVFTAMVGAAAEFVEMPFDRILDAVAAGCAEDGRLVHAGLLIHQSQLTFQQLGLFQVADVGAWWKERTDLPLPLGGNAIRRDLEGRFGVGTLREITGILLRSIRYALSHREESIRYAMGFAPELDRAQADRYIEMYVNDLTLDAGAVGERAICRLLADAHAAGLCPDPGQIELLRAE